MWAERRTFSILKLFFGGGGVTESNHWNLKGLSMLVAFPNAHVVRMKRTELRELSNP